MNAEQTAVLLVRHGQSTWNVERRWQGQAEAPLSDLGRHQATVAATRIGDVDAIVASPLERAFHTATIISDHLGVGPVHTVDGLMERAAGEWSGLTHDEIEERWPGWIDDGRRPEGWEDDTSLLARVLHAVEGIATELPGATVLAVSHGGAILALEQHLGVDDGRTPNLHGRVVHWRSETGSLHAGERLELIPPEISTGGRSRTGRV